MFHALDDALNANIFVLTMNGILKVLKNNLSIKRRLSLVCIVTADPLFKRDYDIFQPRMYIHPSHCMVTEYVSAQTTSV